MTGSISIWAVPLLFLAMTGCVGSSPSGPESDRAENPGETRWGIMACPTSPNCVTSADADAEHSIAALRIEGDARQAWDRLVGLLEATPRVRIVTNERGHLHAEFTSRWMRYVDDVDFVLSADRKEIGVRSASRLGYGDMGVNRARIEWIRGEWADRGGSASRLEMK